MRLPQTSGSAQKGPGLSVTPSVVRPRRRLDEALEVTSKLGLVEVPQGWAPSPPLLPPLDLIPRQKASRVHPMGYGHTPCMRSMGREPWHRASDSLDVCTVWSVREGRTRDAVQCPVDSRRTSDPSHSAAKGARPHQLWPRSHLPCSRTARGRGNARSKDDCPSLNHAHNATNCCLHTTPQHRRSGRHW